MAKSHTLDDIDRKLLELLQVDCQRSVAAIADAVGLSPPACYRRIRRLRVEGVVEREVAIVRPPTLGWSLTMIVLVMLEREGGGAIAHMTRTLLAAPEVLEAWHVTGDFDIAVKIVARDMEGFDEFTQRLFTDDDRVRSFKTLVVMREMKTRSPVPV